MNGYSLLEVMISLALLSLGIIAYLQQSTRITLRLQAYYYQQVALQECLSVYALIQAAPLGLKDNLINQWKRDVTTILPAGQGHVYSEDRVYRISVCWISGHRQCSMLIRQRN